MGGGIIQLVAYGAQDIYLTGNPQITFFKYVYRRHTNFAIENFSQFPIGTQNWGNKLVFNIERKGDLLGECYLDIYIELIGKDISNLPFNLSKAQAIQEAFKQKNNRSFVRSLGYSIINSIEVEIGGETIDTHSGHWMAIYAELTKNFNQRLHDIFLNGPFYDAPHMGENIIHICVPLQFWFNRTPGLFLPLVALQYHDVKINVKLNNKNKFLLNTPASTTETTVYDIKLQECILNCDYVFLDTEERKKFAQVCHEYLIEQVQVISGEFCQSSETEKIIPLNLNHPVKELVWTLNERNNYPFFGEYYSNGSDRLKYGLIQLNGVDRFPQKPGIYFQAFQKNQYHSGCNFTKFF